MPAWAGEKVAGHLCLGYSETCKHLNSVLKQASFEGIHDTATFKACAFCLACYRSWRRFSQGHANLVCRDQMLSCETAAASLLSHQQKMQCCTLGLGCSTQLFEDSKLDRVYFSAWRTSRFLFILSLLSLKCSAAFCGSGALLLQWKPTNLASSWKKSKNPPS